MSFIFGIIIMILVCGVEELQQPAGCREPVTMFMFWTLIIVVGVIIFWAYLAT